MCPFEKGDAGALCQSKHFVFSAVVNVCVKLWNLRYTCISTGHPSVTMAPNFDSDSVLPVLQKPDPPTHLSLLSQSMVDPEVNVSET